MTATSTRLPPAKMSAISVSLTMSSQWALLLVFVLVLEVPEVSLPHDSVWL